MRPRHRLLAVSLALLPLAACGDGGTEPTAGPTKVVIVSHTSTYTSQTGEDRLTLHLRNDGGDGSYLLEFWGLPDSPYGQPRVKAGLPVAVTAAYDETVILTVTGVSEVQAVKVKSRAVDASAWTATDCARTGTAATYCP